MTGSLAVNVSCTEGFRIGVDSSSNIPHVNFALNIKIPIHDLVSALADFQKSSEVSEPPRRPANVPEPKQALPPHLGGPPAVARMHPPPLPTTLVDPPPSQPTSVSWLQKPSTGPEQTGASPSPAPVGAAATPAADGRAGQGAGPRKITWETSIEELQLGHREYVEKTRWTVNGRFKAFILSDESCLRNFEPKPLDPPRRTWVPNSERPAGQARAAPPAGGAPSPLGTSGAPGLLTDMAGFSETDLADPSAAAAAAAARAWNAGEDWQAGAAPYSGQSPETGSGPDDDDDFAEEGTSLPAAVTPPEGGPPPPPGLPHPTTGAAAAAGSLPAAAGRGSWLAKGSQKECKQQ